MKRLISMALVVMSQAMLTAVGAFAATTVDSPHFDAISGFVCTTCHTAHPDLGSTGYNNICTSCHRPGDPAAGKRPLTPSDEADPFGTYSASSRNFSKRYQTSHRWDGPDTVPAAGAQPPVLSQMTTNNLRGRTSQGLACVRCHNQHSNANGSFLRVANDLDQLCMDCHRSRNVQSHLTGSHPVGVNYNTVKGNFNKPPLNTNPTNATSDLNVQLNKTGGVVLCSTCHGVHFTDSRSSTADGSANFANLSTGDGSLLRTERRGKIVDAGLKDSSNICTNCHAGKRNHNLKGQDVQCNDCHGAHVEYDPNDPTGAKGVNAYLVRRAVPHGANGSGTVFFRYTGSQREYKNDQGSGVCQGCHAVPAPGGIYPSEHAGNDPKVCNTCHYHNNVNGSFSGACDVCHGYPPTTATLGGPTGVASPATGATQTSPGAHSTHAKTRFMACNTCHTGYTAKPMPSNSIEMGFSINGNNFPGFAGSATGGKFNGSALNSGYSWTTSTGTSLTTGNSIITCSVYCHGSTLTGGTASPPIWTNTDGSQKTCGACHGVTPATAPTAGSHQRHAGNGAGGLALSCASCHGTIVNNDHVNGSVSWDLTALPGSGTYKGTAAGSTGATAPSAIYGQCSNLYCHSDGTTSIPPFSSAQSPTWGGSPLGCNGCHNSPPAYSSGTPKANSHAVHSGSGYTCYFCHSAVVNSAQAIIDQTLHVNGAYNVSAGGGATFVLNNTPAPTNPAQCSNISCHGPIPNSATWGTSLGCQGCHSGTKDLDVFTTPFSSSSQVAAINSLEWVTSGHGRTSGNYSSGNPAANLSGANPCLYCHDKGIAHNAVSNPLRLLNFSDATWAKNGVCMSCHASGSSGVAVDGVTRNGTRKVSSNHNGYSHTPALNAGQFCWDCHDAHGDGNIYMIHDSIYPASDAATGVPVGNPATVSFTAAATGTDYAKSSAPFNGVCNICHTSTGHYTSTSGDGHNASTRCSSCHPHSASDQYAAFTPSAGACDSCHGYPPASVGFNGTQNNWSSARVENYPGGGGAHTTNNHVSKTAKPSDGFSECTNCHRQSDHKISPTTFLPSTNIKVNLSQRIPFVQGIVARYTSNRLDAASHMTGTCSNISCHFGATPKWDPIH